MNTNFTSNFASNFVVVKFSIWGHFISPKHILQLKHNWPSDLQVWVRLLPGSRNNLQARVTLSPAPANCCIYTSWACVDLAKISDQFMLPKFRTPPPLSETCTAGHALEAPLRDVHRRPSQFPSLLSAASTYNRSLKPPLFIASDPLPAAPSLEPPLYHLRPLLAALVHCQLSPYVSSRLTLLANTVVRALHLCAPHWWFMFNPFLVNLWDIY
jgi:hypothetical protein